MGGTMFLMWRAVIIGLLVFPSVSFAVSGIEVVRSIDDRLQPDPVPHNSILPLAVRSNLAVILDPGVMQRLYGISSLAYVAVFKNDVLANEGVLVPVKDYPYVMDRPDLIGGERYTFIAYPLSDCTQGRETPTNDPCVASAREKIQTDTLPLTSSFAVATGPSPVLFIPGILGSRLAYVDMDGSEKMLWETVLPSSIKALGYTDAGVALTPRMYPTEVVSDLFNIQSEYTVGYRPFTDFLSVLKVEGTISDWNPLPYDWREDVRDIARKGILQRDGSRKSVVKTIQDMASASPSGKVTLVAHSNGGLLAKAVVKELERQKKGELIDEMILIGSPQLGTPKTMATLMHGYFVNHEAARPFMGPFRIASNTMPGTYGLLPSKTYVDRIRSGLIRVNAEPDSMYTSAFGATVNTWSELTHFLSGNGLRTKPSETDLATPMPLKARLLSQANSLHQELDLWSPTTKTIRVAEIAGYGVETIQQLGYDIDEQYKCTGIIKRTCKLHTTYRPFAITSNMGDDTVNTFSGIAMGREFVLVDLKTASTGLKNKYNHNTMLGSSVLQGVVRQFLRREFAGGSNTIRHHPEEVTYSTTVAIHSPANILLSDLSGNVAGLATNESGEEVVKTEIPGSSYTEIGESKFIFVPSSSSYNLSIDGTGSGVFTLDIITTEAGVSKTTTYKDVPVTLDTSGSMSISPLATSPLTVTDAEGTTTARAEVIPSQAEALVGFENLLQSSNLSQRTKRLFANRLYAYRSMVGTKYDRARRRLVLTIKRDISNSVGRTVDENVVNQMLELLEYL